MSEHNEQATLFDFLNLKLATYPEIHPLFFAVPNGSHLAGDARRRSQQVNKLKGEGLVPGVADTVFLSGRGGFLGLALEMKMQARRNEKDGGLSESQMEFLRAAKMEGYQAVVGYGAEDAIEIVSKYLSRPKTQDMIFNALRHLERGETYECMSLLKAMVKVW